MRPTSTSIRRANRSSPAKLVAAEDAGAIAALGIPEENVGRLLADFKAEHAAMAAFFK